jgi:excisionase family DNA binding protein
MILKKQARFDMTTLDPEPGNVDERDFFARVLLTRAKPELVDTSGHRIELPEPIFQMFSQVLALLQRGVGVTFIPHEENLTSQAAANMLGVSRPYLVRLIEAGKIPCTFAGSHRRVKLQDLLAYMQNRDRARHEAMNEMTQEVKKAGLHDKVYIPEE